MSKKVSIIVPIYNVEKYIHECIDSLIGQTYSDVEIILVDDASPDGCPAICDEYAQKDERIRVIHKPNGGLSDARNAGIEIASGDYLIFVDSDDYIVSDMVEQLIYMAEESGADIAACGYSGDESGLSHEIERKFSVATSAEALKYILIEKKINTSASTKLFARELFCEVRFPVGKIYEDYATIYKALHLAKKIAYTEVCKYYYRPNPTGITGRKFYNKQLQYFEISQEVMEFVKREHPKYKKHVNNRAERMAISFYKSVSQAHFDDAQTISFLVKFIRKHIFGYLFSRYAPLSKAYGLMICVMPKTALKVFAK